MSEGRAPRHRNVCFTINADEKFPLLLLDMQHQTWEHVKFCIYQREMGEHEHFQGYVEFSEQRTFAQICSMEGMEGAHLERRKGTAKQAAHYCAKPHQGCDCNQCTEELRAPTKLEGPWGFGEMSQQGQRSELMAVQRDLNKGIGLKRIAEDYFPEFVRFGKAFKDYKRMISVPRDFKTRVVLLVGPPGKGKSTLAKLIASRLGTVYKATSKKGSGMYYDDYDGQDTMILDEFDGARMTPTQFNDLADEHECVLPVHGGAGHQFISKYLIICSNYVPAQWWKNRNPSQLKQTTRRIDVVFKIGFNPNYQARHATYDSASGTWISSSSLLNQISISEAHRDIIPNVPSKDKEELYD